ncbi:MAG: sigma 54-interacting transcriptional regulator [Desulfomonilaceae bacterium]
MVGKIAEVRFLEHKVADLQEELERAIPGTDFSSASPAMQRAVNLGREVAASDANVLLRGGNGTGKSALALAIHHWSNRLERLREPTLRELEPQIDLKMREGSEENGNDATPEPDQVMVCLSSRGPNSEMLLRYASRLAGRLNRNWYAV